MTSRDFLYCKHLHFQKMFLNPRGGKRLHLKNHFTEEEKRKLSESKKGAKNPAWKGGISFKPYCAKFDIAFKHRIRAKFGFECFLCGKSTKENCRALCVHHVNYNKACGCDEDKTCQFVPLCIRCHNKTNANRDFLQALIMEMLKPFEAWNE